ncbi:hypothetical protein LOTGIDRAFT_203978 [Lottia gigantea]|uniref:C2H2-type domain-containing protein n=1 Tax=Lottia gigantea TaxID=225164 RepID=V4A8Z1_LOTGI|nr:hypothetical protein LOTGIDRAFT_203978 [Lottia gigantea]ESO93227.1 hypothetical protein LOTGIDRAFT_203978 [Lottia gigantea]
MGCVGRKRNHKGNHPWAKKGKTKRRIKDLDQIHDDMKPEKADKMLKQDVDYEVPGAAQHYCLHCSRYFISNSTLNKHFRSKPHKRRLKDLSIEPYTQEEADRAGGMGSYIAPKPLEVKTQGVKEDMTTDE